MFGFKNIGVLLLFIVAAVELFGFFGILKNRVASVLRAIIVLKRPDFSIVQSMFWRNISMLCDPVA